MDARETPLVSVVIPARNAESTLTEALDSLIAQSFKRWEAVIIDDGSADRTAAIIDSYTSRDSRFSGLQGAGQGVSAARNLGLAAARGRWVLFLDADDWIEERHLATMTAALAANPGALAAYCGCRRVTPDGSLTADRSTPSFAQNAFELLARSCHVAIHAVLIERDVLTSVGGFDTGLKTCEDWDLWLRVARLGGTWVHVDEPLCYYRDNVRSLSKDAAQLLADAKTVIARGFGVDDRVPHAAPEYRCGASVEGGNTADRAVSQLALWCAAIDCAQGGDGTVALETLAALPPPEVGFAYLPAGALLEGIMVGLCALPEQIAARWEEYGPGITALIAKLGNLWGDPVAGRAIQYHLERLILESADLAQPRCLGLTLGLKVDMRNPVPIAPPAAIDRLYVHLCDGGDVRARVDLGVLGTVTRRQWIEMIIGQFGVNKTIRSAGRSMWPLLLFRLPGHALREVIRSPRSGLRHHRTLLTAAGTKAVLGAAGAPRSAGSHAERLHQLRLETDREAAHADAVISVEKSSPRNVEGDWHANRRSFWENWFEEEDPWNYGSAYEQEKYARQIQLLPDRAVGVALELACAEGRFTEKLADHVDRLIATDISTKALERAQARCREKRNIEFRQLDLCGDPLPSAVDLIFCSEVLYFLNNEGELSAVAKRLAAALKPGGHILTAHAFVLSDDMSRTGFDWGNPYGAETIARVFAETPGLALERSLQTEVYRIDRFMKLDEDAVQSGPTVAEPIVEKAPILAEIEPDVARHLIYGGAVARRCDVALTERRPHVPVLMYHRIASDGPPELSPYRVKPEMFRAQMTWLRRNGYHFIESGHLGWFLQKKQPFAGRPVMISFDDGFQDFADEAWPILRVHDFSAEVFIVSDLVGKTAQWDAGVGGDFPLMDARSIARLSAEGVRFGSHLASHRPADGLSTRELAEELLRSRAALGSWLGKPPHSVAAPFGLTDERLRRLAAECGYTTCFSTQPGVASLKADPMNLPRIEVRGDWTIDEFIGCMERFL
jgi:peptidoglycan/xylan/chitin deacetylase (PgdA/CDA1 family)/2-polyprenyl-3-methyl-5-hydroxy-6-metoxy-1,4-benzoquinol methylase